MKAKVIKTGEIVDVKEWRGASNTIYTRADMNAFYEHFEIELIPDNPEKVTIEGWVALDEFDYGDAFIHTEKPTLNSCAIADAGDYYGCWENPGKVYTIDRSLFPDLTYENSPKKVKITITPIDQ